MNTADMESYSENELSSLRNKKNFKRLAQMFIKHVPLQHACILKPARSAIQQLLWRSIVANAECLISHSSTFCLFLFILLFLMSQECAVERMANTSSSANNNATMETEKEQKRKKRRNKYEGHAICLRYVNLSFFSIISVIQIEVC